MDQNLTHVIRASRVAFCCTLVAILSALGCGTVTTDPLAGWHFSSLVNLQTNDPIREDYQSYINALPPKLKAGIGPIQYFEDGTGQHAVLIEIAQNGTDWAHLLIYDKESKRKKVVKYVSGHYRS